MDTQKLVKECIREIPAAQRQLYDHFAESMLGVCYRYTKSMDDAEDVLQDGFVKVFKNLGQYKYEGELGAWIRRIMVTTALNFLKKNSRYNHDFSFDNENLHPVCILLKALRNRCPAHPVGRNRLQKKFPWHILL